MLKKPEGPGRAGARTEAQVQCSGEPLKNTTVAHLRVVRTSLDMSVVSKEARTFETRYFVLIAATRDTRLTRTDTTVLATILEHCNWLDGRCFPSLVTIAEKAKVADRSVPRSIAKLCACGYLIRMSGGHHRSNSYRWDQWNRNGRVSLERVTDNRVTDDAVSADCQVTDSGMRSSLTRASVEPVTSNQPEERAPASLFDSVPARAGTAERFAEFWAAFPKKQGAKDEAESTWRRKRLDPQANLIIAHVLARAAGDPRWLKDGGQFIPNVPKFLRKELWNDEWEVTALPHRGAGSPFRVASSGLTFEQADIDNARVLARLNPESQVGDAP
jgi:hypothetical protein